MVETIKGGRISEVSVKLRRNLSGSLYPWREGEEHGVYGLSLFRDPSAHFLLLRGLICPQSQSNDTPISKIQRHSEADQ